MCNQIVVDQKMKKRRKCTLKGEPFCKKHNKEECLVCCEKTQIYPTNCCSYKICKKCIIHLGNLECCQCKRKLKLDAEMEFFLLEIQDYKQRIKNLEHQVASLEMIHDVDVLELDNDIFQSIINIIEIDE